MNITDESNQLILDIKFLIENAKSNAVQQVNLQLVQLYWKIGQRIRNEILKQERAEYGQQIFSTLSRKLMLEYGQGFSIPNLFRMHKFYEYYSDPEIFSTLSRKLSWSHFVELLTLEDPIRREFYGQMCRIESWSVRALRNKMQGMLFERTAISKKPDKLIRQELALLSETDLLTPDLVLKDPYILDFLGMKDIYSERDLEKAVLREIESFILELGTDFSFIARQKRIVIDGEDHYIDLLFYHRGLRRIIVIELKLGQFKASYKGQMELYLRWLEKHEKREFEEPPLGIILCASKKQEAIELLELAKNGIHVAEYLTQLPSIDVFKKRLHQAIETAEARQEVKMLAEDTDGLASPKES